MTESIVPPSELWRRAFLIRSFEERLLALFAEGRLQGTVHTCSGQEWSALAVAAALRDSDRVLSNHRGHGHFLARRPDLIRPLLAEIMGLREGLCGGVGGSQHLHADNFYSNGVQGGMTPIAAGMALAEKIRGGDGVVAVFIGDGTTGEGVVYEAMNMAALWRLPLLFVLERNGYAQSTATSSTIAGDLEARAKGFGLTYFRAGVWDWEELCATAEACVAGVRGGSGPALLEIECFRLNAHSKGDDNRPPDLVAAFREKDPLVAFSRHHPEAAEEYARAAADAVDSALAAVVDEPCAYEPEPVVLDAPVSWKLCAEGDGRNIRYGERIYEALRELMADPEAVLLGEDIAAPYGGAFKITRDLGELFPGRVLATPISEAGIVGVSTGLALSGMRPVAEIMFGDFLTLIFDQLQQHAAKFAAMYGGGVGVPLIVRSPSGGRRGYGPTHSQSLEKHFLGIPGLTVAALNARLDPGLVYRAHGADDGPLLAIENKILYTRMSPPAVPPGYECLVSDERLPTVLLRPEGGGADVSVVCYGGMLEQIEGVLADAFRDDEILCEVLCYTRLYPLNAFPLLESLRRTKRLLTLEEGPGFAGWGAETAALAACSGLPLLAVRRIAYDGIIPASAIREAELLPGAAEIHRALREMMSA